LYAAGVCFRVSTTVQRRTNYDLNERLEEWEESTHSHAWNNTNFLIGHLVLKCFWMETLCVCRNVFIFNTKRGVRLLITVLVIIGSFLWHRRSWQCSDIVKVTNYLGIPNSDKSTPSDVTNGCHKLGNITSQRNAP